MREIFENNNDMSPNTVQCFKDNKYQTTQDYQNKQSIHQRGLPFRSKITKLNILNPTGQRQINNTLTMGNYRSKGLVNRSTTQGRKLNTNLKSVNSSHKITFQTPQLRNTILNYKVKSLVYTFIQKLSRNSIHRKPSIYQPFTLDENYNSIGFNGLEFNTFFNNLIFSLNTLHTLFCCILASIIIPFSQKLGESIFVYNFCCIGIVLSLIEILIGFLRVRYKKENKIIKLKEISKRYLHQNFIIDFLSLIIYIINISTNIPHISLTFILFFIKIPGCIQSIKIIQSRILGTFQLQHYYKLFKIILSNFLFAHIIAIIMLLSSNIDRQQNWLVKVHIENTQSYQQYSWSYYWAMTTMLSVGFGDITVYNFKQALVLVIVQAFGCMTLAYNITCISSLLSALESKEMQKNNNINLLRKFNNKNQLQAGIYKQLVNYIQESHKMETKFNHQQSNNLINKLPDNLKSSFLRSVNEKSIKNLTFFKCLTNKTILSIAQKIQAKIAHPQQIICNRNEIINMMIVLKQGQVGLFPHMNRQIIGYGQYISDKLSVSFDYQKKYSSKIVNTVIDKFVVKQSESSKFISLNFLKPYHKVRNYQIRSMKYSLIYQMNINLLLNILKNKDIDIQYYFSIRDKYHGNSQEFQLITCQICSQNNNNKKYKKQYKDIDQQNIKIQKQIIYKHTKFDCSRLHYIPLNQQIIFKYLHDVKNAKCKRQELHRTKKPYVGKNKSVLIQYRLYASVFNTFSQWFKTAEISQRSIYQNYNIFIPSQVNIRSKRLSTGISRKSGNGANCGNGSGDNSNNNNSNNNKQKLTSMKNNINKSRISINQTQNCQTHCIKNMQTIQLMDYISILDFNSKTPQIKNTLLSPNKNIGQNRQNRQNNNHKNTVIGRPTFLSQKLSNLIVQKQIPLQFWAIQIDIAYDFKFYMNNYNPKQLASNYTRTKNIITAKKINSLVNI